MPRGPRRTLAEYAHDRVEKLHRLGGDVRELVLTEAGGEIQLQAIVTFGQNSECLLRVIEALTVNVFGRGHRRKYSYHCMYRDEVVFRYDRDAEGHPSMPEHKHLSSGRRVRWGRVTLQEVADELWDAVAQREEAEVAEVESSTDLSEPEST